MKYSLTLVLLLHLCTTIVFAQNRDKTAQETAFYDRLHEGIKKSLPHGFNQWQVVNETQDHSHFLPANDAPLNKGIYPYSYEMEFSYFSEDFTRGMDSISKIPPTTEKEAAEFSRKLEQLTAKFQCKISVEVNVSNTALTVCSTTSDLPVIPNTKFAIRKSYYYSVKSNCQHTTFLGIGNFNKPAFYKYPNEAGGYYQVETIPSKASETFSIQNFTITIVALPEVANEFIQRIDLAYLNSIIGKKLP